MLSVLKFCVRHNKAVAIGWKPAVMFRVNGTFPFVKCLGFVYSRGKGLGSCRV